MLILDDIKDYPATVMSLNIVQNKVFLFNIQYMNAAGNQPKGASALKPLGATALNHKNW